MAKRNRKPGVDQKHSTGRRRRRPRLCNATNKNKVMKKEISSSNSKKFQIDKDLTFANFTGYRLFDLSLLFKSLEKFLCCGSCQGPVLFSETDVRGLAGQYEIRCKKCETKKHFSSSTIVEDDLDYEINRRVALAMRCIGQGLAGQRTFSGIMDLPPPSESLMWNDIGEKMLKATDDAARECMRKAVEEEIISTTENDEDGASSTHPDRRCITVQGDASWQRLGFSSLNAAFTVIGTETGKVLDQEIMSLFCRECHLWATTNKDATDKEKENWMLTHRDRCTNNCSARLESMEVECMTKIFRRSVERYDVMYTNYIGDGDCQIYSQVAGSMPYGPDVDVKKIECTGHVQKRFGDRARKLKGSLTQKELSDGKTLGRKERLINDLIDEMQTYYGNAIRNNSLSVKDMTDSVWAIWYHKASTDEKPQHQLCPQGENSWCEYRRAEANGRLPSFCHSKKKILPTAVMEAIKPVFEDLTSPDLLQRCVGAKTQTSNDSLHNVIWKFCPKTIFPGMNTVQISSNLGTILYNSGPAGVIEVMKNLGVVPGKHALTATNHRDNV